MRITRPLFVIGGQAVSARDLVLIVGGLFLIFKATWEIYDNVEGGPHAPPAAAAGGTFVAIVIQIMLMDVVFSLDSVITAAGITAEVRSLGAAIAIALVVLVMPMHTVNRTV